MMNLALAWTRTLLAASGFVWMVLLWQSSEADRRARERRFDESIAVLCQDLARQNRKSGMEPVEIDVCEAGYFTTHGGGAQLRVGGTVTADGEVRVQPN